MAEQRVIVAAAVKHPFSSKVICGVRHYDQLMYEWLQHEDPHWRRAEQGFVDNRGEFLTREQAWDVAEAAGQIRMSEHTRRGALHSEDLW